MAAKKKTMSAAFPELAERVNDLLNLSAEPATVVQSGTRRLPSMRTGGTAYGNLKGTNSVVNELFGSGDAVLDVIAEQASDPSPIFKQRQQEMLGRKALADVMSKLSLEAGGRKSSAVGARTVSSAKAKPETRSEAKPKSSATSTTSSELSSTDGPMRSISYGDKSIDKTMAATMPKLEMGAYKGPEAASKIASSVSDMAASRPAPAPATLSGDRIQSLFKKATGTSFDPKSQKDKAARAELEALISGRPDLADASDNKIALAWYKSKKK